MKREAIKEALEKIQQKYIDNATKNTNFVGLTNEISNLLDIAEKELKPNDELLNEIKNTKQNIVNNKPCP
jgi:hypothetical protein